MVRIPDAMVGGTYGMDTNWPQRSCFTEHVDADTMTQRSWPWCRAIGGLKCHTKWVEWITLRSLICEWCWSSQIEYVCLWKKNITKKINNNNLWWSKWVMKIRRMIRFFFKMVALAVRQHAHLSRVCPQGRVGREGERGRERERAADRGRESHSLLVE